VLDGVKNDLFLRRYKPAGLISLNLVYRDFRPVDYKTRFGWDIITDIQTLKRRKACFGVEWGSKPSITK
jgi:hypothetical protein